MATEFYIVASKRILISGKELTFCHDDRLRLLSDYDWVKFNIWEDLNGWDMKGVFEADMGNDGILVCWPAVAVPDIQSNTKSAAKK